MTMRDRAMRLSDAQRTGIRVAGIAATIAAIVFILLAFGQFFGGMPSSPGDPDNFDNARESGTRMFILFAIGGALMLVGTMLLRLGFLRPISELVATETEGAMETVGGAVGRGWSSTRPNPASDIRVRCKACGNLESENAKFCSACGEQV